MRNSNQTSLVRSFRRSTPHRSLSRSTSTSPSPPGTAGCGDDRRNASPGSGSLTATRTIPTLRVTSSLIWSGPAPVCTTALVTTSLVRTRRSPRRSSSSALPKKAVTAARASAGAAGPPGRGRSTYGVAAASTLRSFLRTVTVWGAEVVPKRGRRGSCGTVRALLWVRDERGKAGWTFVAGRPRGSRVEPAVAPRAVHIGHGSLLAGCRASSCRGASISPALVAPCSYGQGPRLLGGRTATPPNSRPRSAHAVAQGHSPPRRASSRPRSGPPPPGGLRYCSCCPSPVRSSSLRKPARPVGCGKRPPVPSCVSSLSRQHDRQPWSRDRISANASRIARLHGGRECCDTHR